MLTEVIRDIVLNLTTETRYDLSVNFLSGDRINIALDRNGGTCMASDETTPCGLAIDGREDPETSSWLAERDSPQHWIRVDFASTVTVDTVEILQHCSHNDKAKKILLDFSDASNGTVNEYSG